jgi:hypothetical protein
VVFVAVMLFQDVCGVVAVVVGSWRQLRAYAVGATLRCENRGYAYGAQVSPVQVSPVQVHPVQPVAACQ